MVWLSYHKKKWRYQMLQKKSTNDSVCNKRIKTNGTSGGGIVRSMTTTLGGFLQKNQRTLMTSPWQIIQIATLPNKRDEYKLWALVQNELHQIKLIVPKIFYANLRTEKDADDGDLFQKCNKTLPRGAHVYNLYKYTVSNRLFDEFSESIYIERNDPNVEGIYELNTPNLFRTFLHLGCVCRVATKATKNNTDTFVMNDLETTTLFKQFYLPKDSIKRIYLYQHRALNGPRQMFALFLTPIKKALIVVVDSVRTNLMPNMHTLYQAEFIAK